MIPSLCLLYFTSFSSFTPSLPSLPPYSPSTLIHSFNHSITLLGGIFSFTVYQNHSTFNFCNNHNSKKVFYVPHIESISTLPIPKDYILYLSHVPPILRSISTTPSRDAIIEKLKSHSIWASNRLLVKKLLNFGIKPKFVPLVSPFQSHSQSQLTIYVLGKCDPYNCELIQHLVKLGSIPVIVGESKLKNCQHGQLQHFSFIHYSTFMKSFDFSNSILLYSHLPSSLSSSSSSLSSIDLFWMKYFLFHNGTLICDSSLKNEFNRLFFQNRIVFTSNITQLTLQSLQSLHSLHSQSQFHEPDSHFLPASYLRCELFSNLHSFHTNVNPHQTDRSLPLTLSGTLATQSKSHLLAFSNQFIPPSSFRVLAIMAGFNEADVLASSIVDLIEQGCHVHYLDNWSTDSTQQLLRQIQLQYSSTASLTFELFPSDSRPRTFNWEDILTKKKIISETTSYDWILHIDPDEIRESPWGTHISLRQALFLVDRLGFNVVNFAKLVIFHPIKSKKIFKLGDNLKESFQYFELNSFHGNNFQLKAWKTYRNTSYHDTSLPPQSSKFVYFDLVTYGGHAGKYFQPTSDSYLPELRVFPLKFILRHYPFRSEEHGRKKVFEERKSRWNQAERRDYGWHIQYDQIFENHQFVREDTSGLLSLEENNELPSQLYDTILPCPQ